jgi:hypothetical protein
VRKWRRIRLTKDCSNVKLDKINVHDILTVDQMMVRRAIFSILASFLALTVVSSVQAEVDTRFIDEVRKKQVLTTEDLQIIDDFLKGAIRELIRTRDFTSVAKARTIILERQSTQKQYARQFSESAYQYISSGFEQAEQLSEERKFKVDLNLLILIDSLEDTHLAELAMDKLNSENTAIRYWAVRSVTNPNLLQKLNPDSEEAPRFISQIAERLKPLVNNSEPEILTLMAEFAAKSNLEQCEQLLLQIAEMRIDRYADWKVEHALVDGVILKLLSRKISSSNLAGSAFARCFAQLYSYAIQRYIKGRDILSDVAKGQLASILIETEDKCISELLGAPQSTIKRAIERNDYSALLQEHDRLLGGTNEVGQLPLKFRFDYGTNGGDNRKTPLVLPDPPKEPKIPNR